METNRARNSMNGSNTEIKFVEEGGRVYERNRSNKVYM